MQHLIESYNEATDTIVQKDYWDSQKEKQGLSPDEWSSLQAEFNEAFMHLVHQENAWAAFEKTL